MKHDVDALVVVRVPDAQAAARAADRLLRSGAFGLIVMDLNSNPMIPIPLQARLVQQARAHDTVLLCLTSKAREVPSLGSIAADTSQVFGPILVKVRLIVCAAPRSSNT